jgi:hypothetical protein
MVNFQLRSLGLLLFQIRLHGEGNSRFTIPMSSVPVFFGRFLSSPFPGGSRGLLKPRLKAKG